MRMKAMAAAPLAAALCFVVGGTWLVLTCGSCGGGGSSPPTGGSGALTVTGASPAALDSELHTPFEVIGTGFAPVGGTATVRLDATSGTPFLGGTTASVEVPGNIASETEIGGVTGVCGISGTAEVRVTVILPDSTEATSSDPLITIYGPWISSFAPTSAMSGESVPFLITGDGFGETGNALTVRFTAASGTPFVGGTQAAADVVGTIGSPNTLTGMTPVGVTGTLVEVTLSLLCPSGAQVQGPWPMFTILPPPQVPSPPELPEGAGFGGAMDIEGNIAAVGAPGDDGLYLYVWDGSEWVLSEVFRPADLATDALFGCAVAISGNTVIVGACQDDVGGDNHAGSAYVYVYDEGTWFLQQKLTAPSPDVQDQFGMAVAIDGNTAAIAAPYEDAGGGNRSGAVYVWVRSGDTWSLEQTLSADDGDVQDCLGTALALQGDTLVAGACFEDESASNAGAAYVFTRSAGTWTQRVKLRASDGLTGDEFAGTLALDSGTLLVGAARADVGGHSDAGAVYVFTGGGDTWTEQAKLIASDADAGDSFGAALDLSADLAVIGAPFRSGTALFEGAAYKFERDGASWTQVGLLLAPTPQAGDQFGSSVVINDPWIYVGAPGADLYGPNAGAVFVY